MPSVCSICKMNPQKFKKANRKGHFSMHLVPRDPRQFEQWKAALRECKLVPGRSMVCSLHFRSSDYVPTDIDDEGNILKQSLRYKACPVSISTNNENKDTNRLKPESAQSALKTLPEKEPSSSHVRQEMNEKDRLLKEIAIMHDQMKQQQATIDNEQAKVFNKDQVIKTLNTKYIEERKKTALLENSAISQSERYKNLQTENYKLREINENLLKQISEQKIKEISLQQKASQLNILRLRKEWEDQLQSKNPKLLTPKVMELLTGKVSKVQKWDTQDIANAFAALAVSRKTLKFVREVLRYPMPGLTSLKRYKPDGTVNNPDEIDIEMGDDDKEENEPENENRAGESKGISIKSEAIP